MKFRLTIVTPEKPVLECEADYVSLPAAGGELGVLARHAPCAVQLREGVLRYRGDGKSGEFAVMGGFAEIYQNSVSVFAEAAELADEINEELERQQLQRSRAVLASRAGGTDIEAAEAQLRRSSVRLRVREHMRRKRAA